MQTLFTLYDSHTGEHPLVEIPGVVSARVGAPDDLVLEGTYYSYLHASPKHRGIWHARVTPSGWHISFPGRGTCRQGATFNLGLEVATAVRDLL